MKIEQKNCVKFSAIGPLGDRTDLRILHGNRGEPYREGVEFSIDTDDHRNIGVFLDDSQAIEIRNLLNQLYPAADPNLRKIAHLAREARPAHYAEVLDRIEKIAVEANKKALKG